MIGGLPRGSTMIQAYGIDTSNRPNDYIEPRDPLGQRDLTTVPYGLLCSLRGP